MKRAGNNEGCFFVRKDGRHCYAITIKENGNTKRKYFYGLNNFELIKKVNNYYNSIKIKIDDISIQQMYSADFTGRYTTEKLHFQTHTGVSEQAFPSVTPSFCLSEYQFSVSVPDQTGTALRP